MKKVFGLLLLLSMLSAWGCAETDSNATVRRASTCAMCGASVSGDYFAYTADRAYGPTNR